MTRKFRKFRAAVHLKLAAKRMAIGTYAYKPAPIRPLKLKAFRPDLLTSGPYEGRH
jgi:hypothetical protein